MPTKKVTNGGLAGGLSILIVWVVSYFGNVEIPPEVASALTTVLGFVTAYCTTEPASPVG